MRMIHTSDWHLGRLFFGESLTEEQAALLNEFVAVAKETKPDVILIAGDVYDRSVPAADAVALLDETLTRLVLDGDQVRGETRHLESLGERIRDVSQAPDGLPWFITGFLLIAAINSIVAIPKPVQGAAATGAQALLLLAIVATAMKARLALLLDQGWRSFAPIIVATLTSFLLSLAAAVSL